MFFAFGFFYVGRFCDDAEEASLKVPWRPTAAVEAGARGLAERLLIRPFGVCKFFAHWRQPTSGCCRAYRLLSGSLRSAWYWCVYDMHDPNGLRNSRSASPSSPT